MKPVHRFAVQTAYLTHVRLTHLRWMAGVMAPKAYRLKLAEPEAPRERQTVLYRRFEIEVNKEMGKREVISWRPGERRFRRICRQTPLSIPRGAG